MSRMSTKSLVQVALFAALIAVLAQISIPLPGGVPLTLQTFAIFLAGSLLGARRGALSVLVYILLGAVGIPVFASGKAGAGVLLGPTGGYLIGFVIGAFVLGWLVERSNRPRFTLMALGMLAAIVISYSLGTIQFVLVTRMPLLPALGLAVLPFLPLEVGKLFLAAALAVKARATLVAAGLIDVPAAR